MPTPTTTMARFKLIPCLLGVLSVCGLASLHAQNFDSLTRSLDLSLESAFERPETASISSRSDVSTQISRPPAAERMAVYQLQVTTQKDTKAAGKNPVMLTPPSPWGYVFTGEVAPLYDTNPLYQSTDGPDDWHLNYELKGVISYTVSEKLALSLLGLYNGARYDELSSLDADIVTAGGGVSYLLRPTTTITLSDAFSWGYERGFGDEVFNRNRVALAVTEDVTKVLNLGEWSVKITPSVRWDSYDDSAKDRGTASVNAELGRKLTDKLGLTLSFTEGYTTFDSGNHYWDTELKAELGYQITKNVAVAARVYYLNRGGSESGDFDQFTVAPVVGLSAKF